MMKTHMKTITALGEKKIVTNFSIPKND